MPPPPYIPDGVAHVRILGSIGDAGEYGIGFWTTCESANVSTLSDFAEAVANAFAAGPMADASEDAVLSKVRVLSYQSDVEYAGQFTTHVVGAYGGHACPPSVCAVIDWLEALTYRGGHPRSYMWGVPVDAVDQSTGTLSSAYRSAASSNWAAFLDAFNAIDVDPSIEPSLSTLHRVAGGVELTPGYLGSLAAPGVRQKLGTQRLRINAA